MRQTFLHYLTSPAQTSSHIALHRFRHGLDIHVLTCFRFDCTLDITIHKEEGVFLDVIRPHHVIDIAWWVLPEALDRDIARACFASRFRYTQAIIKSGGGYFWGYGGLGAFSYADARSRSYLVRRKSRMSRSSQISFIFLE